MNPFRQHLNPFRKFKRYLIYKLKFKTNIDLLHKNFNVNAALLLPPPNPPPIGIRFIKWTEYSFDLIFEYSLANLYAWAIRLFGSDFNFVLPSIVNLKASAFLNMRVSYKSISIKCDLILWYPSIRLWSIFKPKLILAYE